MNPTPERAYLFRGAEILVPLSGGPWLEPGALDGLGLERRREYPARGAACLAAALSAAPAHPAGYAPGRQASQAPELVELPGLPPLKPLPFRAALAELPHEEASRASKGLALLNWLGAARFCGGCGAELADDGTEGYAAGARRCPACARVYYPRVSPAVILLVRREGKILLAHNAAFPAGRYGLIAGFVEPGESLEEAARRELLEETGIEVGELRYSASQPWPFPDSLMVGFEAEWRSGEGKPDGVELTELLWRGPDELPSIPPPGSIARRLIDGFLRSAASS